MVLKQIDDSHTLQYKVLKSQWRLFHKTDPDARRLHFLFGINEYMTEQRAFDFGLDHQLQLQTVYEAYLNLHNALMSGNTIAFWRVLDTYRNTGNAVDRWRH